MQHFSLRTISFLVSTLILGFSASACINQANTPTVKTAATDEQVGVDSKITWETGTKALQDRALVSGLGSYASQYCFQNNILSTTACTRPDTSGDVVAAVGAAPVMVQGFQPMINLTNYSSVNITRASVTMALLTINTATGKPSFTRRHVRSVYPSASDGGVGCDPTAKGSMGIPAPNEGEEYALTGLYLYDDGVPAGNLFSQVVDTSTLVSFSGIVPAASSGADIFRYDYVPKDAAETRSFGVQAYSDSGKVLPLGSYTVTSSDSVGRLNYFGLDSNYASNKGLSIFYDDNNNELWSQFVVIGFCIEGTKTVKAGGQNAGQQVPIFLRAEAYRQRPKMLKL